MVTESWIGYRHWHDSYTPCTYTLCKLQGLCSNIM